jgi:ribosomal protein S18 acetylase RimI-like enzyme
VTLMTKAHVRAFRDTDAENLSALMMEMAAFYGAEIDKQRDIIESIRANARSVEIIIAELKGKLIGFATFGIMYPVAGLIPYFYVQQIYVSIDGRRMGIARSLMAVIARIAISRGIERVEWSTGKSNVAAQALYTGIGAEGEDKVHFVLKGRALRDLGDI